MKILTDFFSYPTTKLWMCEFLATTVEKKLFLIIIITII